MSVRAWEVAKALAGWSGRPGPIKRVKGCTAADVAAAINVDVSVPGPYEWCGRVAYCLDRGLVTPNKYAAVVVCAVIASYIGDFAGIQTSIVRHGSSLDE